jgi:hypothetical protein
MLHGAGLGLVDTRMRFDCFSRVKRLRGRFETGCHACSSPSKALASFRSSVSKPSMNQP